MIPGEISHPKYRGILLAAVSLAISVGLFVVHLFGTFLSWQLTASLCALFPLGCYILIFMVPETPSWLVYNNRLKEAEESFRYNYSILQTYCQVSSTYISNQN